MVLNKHCLMSFKENKSAFSSQRTWLHRYNNHRCGRTQEKHLKRLVFHRPSASFVSKTMRARCPDHGRHSLFYLVIGVMIRHRFTALCVWLDVGTVIEIAEGASIGLKSVAMGEGGLAVESGTVQLSSLAGLNIVVNRWNSFLCARADLSSAE